MNSSNRGRGRTKGVSFSEYSDEEECSQHRPRNYYGRKNSYNEEEERKVKLLPDANMTISVKNDVRFASGRGRGRGNRNNFREGRGGAATNQSSAGSHRGFEKGRGAVRSMPNRGSSNYYRGSQHHNYNNGDTSESGYIDGGGCDEEIQGYDYHLNYNNNNNGYRGGRGGNLREFGKGSRRRGGGGGALTGFPSGPRRYRGSSRGNFRGGNKSNNNNNSSQVPLDDDVNNVADKLNSSTTTGDNNWEDEQNQLSKNSGKWDDFEKDTHFKEEAKFELDNLEKENSRSESDNVETEKFCNVNRQNDLNEEVMESVERKADNVKEENNSNLEDPNLEECNDNENKDSTFEDKKQNDEDETNKNISPKQNTEELNDNNTD